MGELKTEVKPREIPLNADVILKAISFKDIFEEHEITEAKRSVGFRANADSCELMMNAVRKQHPDLKNKSDLELKGALKVFMPKFFWKCFELVYGATVSTDK